MRPRCVASGNWTWRSIRRPTWPSRWTFLAVRLNKLSIYADIGVPEVWLYDGQSLRSHQLQSDGVT